MSRLGSLRFRADAYPRPALGDLEARFLREEPAPLPTGRVVGRFLGFVDSPGAARPLVRALDTVLFRALRWGLDFGSQRWWFEHPRLAAGHFRVVLGPSRWRDTRVWQLHYDASRLPLRRVLYDEVKPLSDGRVLGLGGVNADRGEGDHFFFDLTKREARP